MKVFKIIPRAGRAEHFAESMCVLAHNQKNAMNAYMSYNRFVCSLRHQFDVIEYPQGIPLIVAESKEDWTLYEDWKEK